MIGRDRCQGSDRRQRARSTARVESKTTHGRPRHDILSGMKAEDLRAYAQRAWKVAEARKQEHWAREFVEHGPQATFEASQVLWRHMRSIRPDWPSPEERREDLAHHIALKQLIDRAAGAFVAAHR